MSKYIPELYDQLSKVQFFYNEFKSRNANPEGFDNKMKYWFSSIDKYCQVEDKFLIDLNEIRKEFEYLNCNPQLNCIRLVFTNMIKERKLLPIDEFKQEFLNQNNSSWLNWGFNSVKKTIGWFSSSVSANTNYVEQIDDQLKNNNIKFVHLNTFDRIARNLLNYIREHNLNGQILKYDVIEDKLCNDLNLDKKQLDLILKFLESKNNCKIIESNYKLIKFDESNVEITDKELSLKRLEDAKLMIEQDMDKIEEEIEKYKEEAREAIKQNNKSKGLSILKKKQRLTQQLERKQNQLDNIEILEDQLLNSDANQKILEVLAKSSEVLKVKNNADDVDDLLFTIEEAMESHKTFLQDISRPIGGQQFDDDELEQELNQLIEDDEIEKIANNSKEQIKSKIIDQTTNDESDDLLERLHRLKQPPTSNKKKEKVKIALTDDL